MTKDEFLFMLNGELESLEQEYQIIIQRYDYFRQVNLNGKEFKETEYQLKMIQQKINLIRNLVNLPAYARIQAMSNEEIEEYKRSKTEELELNIKEIEAREEKEKAKLSQLKAEQEQLMSQFGNLSGSERYSAIYRGQQLSAEISSYDVNNQWGIFAQLKREIEEIKKQQEQIKAMTSQEVKQQISSKIKESHDLAQIIEWTKKPIDAFTELLASVASDPEKAQQMANLLAYYRRLSDEQSQIKGRVHLSDRLPKYFIKNITEYSRGYYNPSTNEINNPDRLIEIVKFNESIFEQVKTTFNEQFTEQKLSKLVGKEYGIDSSEVDMDFLQQHTDKLSAGELSFLKNLVEQRNELSKKIFKTRDTKWKIGSLNSQIKQLQSIIYKEIIGWYESRSKDILGISYGLQFYNLEVLKSSLERCKEEIARSEQAIDEIKERIQEVKAEMEQQKQNYETRKTEIAKQIRILGGKEHEEIVIPYTSDRSDNNLDKIANASNLVYRGEIINKVQKEAQNQVDIREAELRGITVEQLLQMRQQSQGVTDESMTETAEGKTSHEMKM